MASVFLDSQSVIMVDYLQEGCTINGAHYAEELRRLRQRWRKCIEAKGDYIKK